MEIATRRSPDGEVGAGLFPFAARAAFALVLAAAVAAGPAAAENAPGAAAERELTLAECIALALRNNRDLASGRLGRATDKLSLEDAEGAFLPVPSVETSVKRDWRFSESGREATSRAGVSSRVSVRLPTGGSLGLGPDVGVTNRDTAVQSIVLNFTHPLLTGAGTGVGTADLRKARRSERAGLLDFKSAVMGLVTATVYAYRNVVRARRAVEIQERSLQRSRELRETNRLLIETGRMAAQDIVETEANIAARELSLTEARGALDRARLALIDLLDVDGGVGVRPVEEPDAEPLRRDADRSLELALENRPDFLRSLLRIEDARTNVLVAEDARRWDLGLTATARLGNDGSDLKEAYSRFDEDYSLGLLLKIPVGATVDAQRRAHVRARIALRQSRLRHAELRQAIGLEVREAVHDAAVQYRRTELARRARQLAERKLEVERAKLRAGLSSNFRLVRFEDDLVQSQSNEVGAIVAYRNALTKLDRIQGTTLGTWGIEIDSLAAAPPDDDR